MSERWKMIYLARRNPALRAEQFSQAWRGHSALGAGCTNVRDKVLSVMQCSRVLDGAALPGAATDYDGVNLLALRDLQAATDIWNDPETLAIMRPDEPRVFSTYVRHFSLVCREQVLHDVPRGACCLIGFVKYRVGQSASTVTTDTTALPGAGRVVCNAVHLPPPPGYDFDAIIEWWYDSADAAHAALGDQAVSTQLEQWAPSLASAIEPGASVFMFTQVTHSRP